jgi:hypothetical protein
VIPVNAAAEIAARAELEKILMTSFMRHPFRLSVARHLDRMTIARLAEPTTYSGGSLEMIDAVLAAIPSSVSCLETT